MKLIDLLNEAIFAISANKVRSGLTILGIVIGIASVIAMISIGQGAKSEIVKSIQGLGSNVLTVMPGGARIGAVFMGRGTAQILKEDDVKILKAIEGVVDVVPIVQRTLQIVAPNGNNTRTSIIGATPEIFSVREISIEKGSIFNEEQVRNISRVAVLGKNIANDLFGEENPVGKIVRISGVNFKVIGVAAPKGGVMGMVADDLVFVPFSTMQKVLAKSEYLTLILLKGKNKEVLPQIQKLATLLLAEKHRVDPQNPDFTIISQEDILSTLTQVTTVFTIFLGAVAGISLLVGGIGIMNMMLTSVTERTREIGLRKAIGAKNKEILAQILTESVLLTFLGGAMGVFLGWLISLGISKIFQISTQVSIFAVILAFLVSAAIGIFFGWWPAQKAAKLSPIEALRYE
jgi:putative ABC transport system permease protein